MSSFELSQICKVAGEVVTFLLLLKASKEDVRTRTVANKFPIVIALIFALSSVGAWFFMPEAMPLTLIATQVVFALGIGLLLLVVTVGLEKVQHTEIFGGGDIKIIAATTLFLEVSAFMATMLVSCVLFLFGALTQRRKFDSWAEVALPFVPFWTAGFAVVTVLSYIY